MPAPNLPAGHRRHASSEDPRDVLPSAKRLFRGALSLRVQSTLIWGSSRVSTPGIVIMVVGRYLDTEDVLRYI